MSFAGVSYAPTKKGLVKVPDEAVRELLDFGFTVAPPEDSMDADAAAAYLQANELQALVQEQAAERAVLAEDEAQRQAALREIDSKLFGN